MLRDVRPPEPIGESPALRPRGVAIIALLTGISGLLSIGDVLGTSLWLAGESGGDGLPPAATLVRFLVPVAAGLFLAWGTWNLKPWAWTVQIMLHVLGVVINISKSTGRLFNPIIWGFALTEILILYYLLQPGVRLAFGRARPHTD